MTKSPSWQKLAEAMATQRDAKAAELAALRQQLDEARTGLFERDKLRDSALMYAAQVDDLQASRGDLEPLSIEDLKDRAFSLLRFTVIDREPQSDTEEAGRA